MSKAAGVDRKTFQKWAWKMISTISWLEGDVVSVQIKLVYVFLMMILVAFIVYCCVFLFRLIGRTGLREILGEID